MAHFPGAASASTISQLLGDLNFPVHKRQLLQHARGKGAGEDICAALEELLEEEYRSLDQVTAGLTARRDVRGRGDRDEHRRHDSAAAHRAQGSQTESGRLAAHPRDGGAPGGLIPQLAHALSDLRFPAGTSAMVEHAQAHGAGDRLVAALQALPPRDFDTIDEVFAAFAEDLGSAPPAGRKVQRAPNLQNMLGDAIFPAWKQDLAARARDNGADDDLLEALEKLPQRQYGDVSEVLKALGGGADSSRQSRGSPSGGRPVS